MVYLSSTEKPPLKRPVPLARMSDGELTFLALLSLIFAPEDLGTPLYCIEEPESHLHPHMLETLVEIQRQRQDELGPNAAQIIATTHSPQLVDKMRIDDLIIVEKMDGQTKFSRPSDD
jgi:predicted ATPase